MKLLKACIPIILTFAACSQQASLPPELASQSLENRYTASKSTEAIMNFDYAVETDISDPNPADARKLIEAQLIHLFGPMSAASHPATPKENHQLSKIKVLKKQSKTLVSYHYSGTIVVENGTGPTYTILLPRNPETIYEAATVELPDGRKSYPCTDVHYTSKGDFWYFWNPAQENCKLEEGVHYDKIEASIQRISNKARTYPEYNRLVNQNGEITMSLFFGMDDINQGRNPLTSKDASASNFRGIRKSLTQLGYSSRVLTSRQISQLLGFTPDNRVYLEEFTKSTRKARFMIRLFFGPTGINESSRAFHYLYKEALENHSVMIYDGHSGLGGHLDIEYIENLEGFKIQPNESQYQIYFFNSCTSYTYYNQKYFKMKSTKNLDILANGLSTSFGVMHDTNLVILKAIDAWASGRPRTSYQELAGMIDSNNLFGVNGDEDNPMR